ncbi:MAG: CoA transferase [Candidatus Tectomicrobia bacterium]|nr:CoA transferase [Candidatus Tectomicrobia bacterium]
MRALEGIRVLDFSRVLAGPYCTMILADLGAEVVKVELPGRGDFARENGPFVQGQSSYFISVNRGKKSVTLDLKKPEGKEIAARLAGLSDVLVENFRPGVMDRLGLGPESLRQRNPRLVYASITGFGQTGPYADRPAYDMIVQAMGGLLSMTGMPDGPPVRAGYSIGDLGAAVLAAVGILAALLERERSGLGQRLDLSMLDAQVAFCENAVARYFATAETPRPMGSRHPISSPFQAFPTRDGYIVVAMAQDEEWRRFCRELRLEDLARDPRFQNKEDRFQNHSALEPRLSELFRARTTDEWVEILGAMSIPCGPVLSIDQVVADPQVRHREMVVERPQAGLGAYPFVNSPIRLDRTPARVERGAPSLGEHTEEILRDLLGMQADEVRRLRERGVV